MKINKHFDIREFIPESEYNKIMKLSEDDRLNAFYKLINPELVELAVFIREFFGKPMVINNWHKGGIYSLRGWRPLNCKIGAKNSDHKKKMAIDFNIVGLTDDFVKEKIIFKLDWRKRLGAIIYQPEDEKKELFCEKVKYEGKADKTLEEKLGSEEYNKFIKHCEELCNKPLLPAESFQRYVYGTPGFWDSIKNAKIDFVYTNTNLLKEDLEKAVSDCFKEKYRCTVKQITPNIQHVITPSKNYFLFKLS